MKAIALLLLVFMSAASVSQAVVIQKTALGRVLNLSFNTTDPVIFSYDVNIVNYFFHQILTNYFRSTFINSKQASPR